METEPVEKMEFVLVCVSRGPVMGERFCRVVDVALEEHPCQRIYTAATMQEICNCRVLFAVELGADGVNLEYYALLRWLRQHPAGLQGCTGAVLVDGEGDHYTKSVGRELVLAANNSGCAFIGRPLVEGVGSLHNFKVQARLLGADLLAAYHTAAKELVDRLFAPRPAPVARPKLLALHASSRATSNTLTLWGMVRPQLTGFEIQELSLRNGALEDCAGCPYETCLHFGEKGQCFYGGPMVEEVYPAVLEADAVVMLCANYNDALAANLTAFINRLTSIFRIRRFYDKRLYAVVVSGYSGGELVAQQLISAMNMNKSFYLPPWFSLQAIANEAGEVMHLPDIQDQADAFAVQIRDELCSFSKASETEAQRE